GVCAGELREAEPGRRIKINNAERMNARALSSDATARHTGWSSIRRTWLASQILRKDARAVRDVGKPRRTLSPESARQPSHKAQELKRRKLNLSSCIHSVPSDLYNGTANNPSLLQRNACLLDLFQGISVGHQPP